MIDCDVVVPDGIVGVLPYRDHKDKKLIFPQARGEEFTQELNCVLRYGMEPKSDASTGLYTIPNRRNTLASLPQ